MSEITEEEADEGQRAAGPIDAESVASTSRLEKDAEKVAYVRGKQMERGTCVWL